MSMRPPTAARLADGRAIALALAAFILSACGSSPRETFDLSGASRGDGARTQERAIVGRATVAVNEPESAQPVNSDRIIVRTGERGLAFLAGAQWADRLPRLVQTRLVARLRSGGVAASLPGAVVDAQISSRILRFEIDPARQMAVVEIAVRLIDDKTGRERAERVIEARAPAPDTTGAEAARALEEALDGAASRIAAWTRARI
jgi:cholesterol transport system auxiliary component